MRETLYGTAGRCRGFLNMYLLVGLTLIGMLVGAIAVANRASGDVGRARAAAAYAKSIIQTGAALHAAYLRLQGSSASSIPLHLTEAPGGLYDPSQALIAAQSVPSGATQLGVPVAYFSDARSIKLNPTGDAADVAVVAVGISDAVCSQINSQLHGAGAPDPLASRMREGCTQIQLACKPTPSNVYYRVVRLMSYSASTPMASDDCSAT